MDVKYLQVDIVLNSNSVRFPVYGGSHLEKLYEKYQADPTDENFETLAEWIAFDVADELDFYVDAVEEV